MRIRSATPNDAAALLSIYAPYVRHTAVTFEYEVPSEEEFAGRISAGLSRYPYLVLEDGQILGYACASPFKERAAYDWAVETTVYLRMDARGRGYGRALYTALEDALRKQGILNAYACIACTDTEDEYLTNASRRFHERMGYRLCGTFRKCGCKFGRWYDMIWMEKMLGEHQSPPAPVRQPEDEKKNGQDVPSELIIASNNQGKIREYKDIFEPLGFRVFSQGEKGIRLEVEETGATFAENAILKARAIYDIAHCCVVSDDSGLMVDALGGEPGIYSARYRGLATEHERRMAILDALAHSENRRAQFVCCICFVDAGGEQHLFQGVWNGVIAEKETGTNGFGYDPIFISEDAQGRTTASLPIAFKEKYSHRAKAVQALMDYLGRGAGADGEAAQEKRHPNASNDV